MVQTLFFIALTYLLLLAVGQTAIQLGIDLARGYEYVPHWFADHVWVAIAVFLVTWAFAPRRKLLEVVGFAVLLQFPLLAYTLNGSVRAPAENTPWALGDKTRDLGTFFAYAVTTFIVCYCIYVIVARFRSRHSKAKIVS